VLVVTGLRVGVTVDGLHLPLGILECHLLILVLLGVHLLFALPLAGRCAFLAWLLLLLTELIRELLDLPALTHTMARGVMYQASCATIIAAARLMGKLVTLWASVSTSRYSSRGSGGIDKCLAVAAGFLVVVALVVVAVVVAIVVVAIALGVGLTVLSYRRGR
jgi:hypothetical protein